MALFFESHMWTLLAFISAVCLGGYDISKKIALRKNAVVDVLTLSICISCLLLSIPLLLSRCHPEWMDGTLLYVPSLDLEGHLFTILKSVIVLSSWVFAYISLKHLPLSVVSPMQATRPMWTLVGALVLFDERLNGWQWVGVLLAIGSIFLFSFRNRNAIHLKRTESGDNLYYICLALAILIGACSGLYDKYMMRRYDHNAVQVYYTLYQAIMMLGVWLIDRFAIRTNSKGQTPKEHMGIRGILPIIMISVFLVISDNVYMLALRDPESMIAVVSTIRRGGAVIGFGYGLVVLKEGDVWQKVTCMTGICAGLVCLAIGS